MNAGGRTTKPEFVTNMTYTPMVQMSQPQEVVGATATRIISIQQASDAVRNRQ